MDPGQGWATNRFSPHQAQGRPPVRDPPLQHPPMSGGAQTSGQTGRAASREGGLPAPLPRDETAA